MRKFISIIVFACFVLGLSVSYAGTIKIGGTDIEYNSIEELQDYFASIKKRISEEYKTVLFDAETFDDRVFKVGENFPAGRYYVFPIVVSDENTDPHPEIDWWEKGKMPDKDSYTGRACAEWRHTIELTDGMSVRFDWDDDERGVCIAMQKMPSDPISLMDAFD